MQAISALTDRKTRDSCEEYKLRQPELGAPIWTPSYDLFHVMNLYLSFKAGWRAGRRRLTLCSFCNRNNLTFSKLFNFQLSDLTWLHISNQNPAFCNFLWYLIKRNLWLSYLKMKKRKIKFFERELAVWAWIHFACTSITEDLERNGFPPLTFQMVLACLLFSHWLVSGSFVTPWTVWSPQGSSVHGISQERVLEWVAFSFSRGSSPPRDQSHSSCIGRQILYHWATECRCSLVSKDHYSINLVWVIFQLCFLKLTWNKTVGISALLGFTESIC